MKDYLAKAITNDGMFRAYAINATQMVTTAQVKHDTWSAASAALGRTLVAATLLATSTDKSGKSITVKINGGGPVGGIVVEADSNGYAKGYVANPHTELTLNNKNEIDVGQVVGVNGYLEVTKNVMDKEPYTSSVPLTSGEIGDDFTFYLAQSEQIPSALAVSVLVNSDNSIQVAGGYLIQVLPGASEEAISQLEEKLKTLPALSEMLIANKTPEEILNQIFGEKQLQLLTTMPVEFYCNCSKERFANDLVGIPVDQLTAIRDEQHGMEIVCNFCHNKYEYSEEQLNAIIDLASQSQQEK